MESVNKTALITGASSGMGYHLTKLFAKNGYNLVLVARTRDDLEGVSEKITTGFGAQQITTIPKDLSNAEVFAESKAFILSLGDALINKLKDTNITLISIPGHTETVFFNKADMQNTVAASMPDAEKVVKEEYEALMKRTSCSEYRKGWGTSCYEYCNS